MAGATAVWIGAAGASGNDPLTATNWLASAAPGAGDDWLLDHRAVRELAAADMGATIFRHFRQTEGYKLGIPPGSAGFLKAKFTATGALVKVACAGKDLYLAFDANDMAFEGLGIGVGHFGTGTLAALAGINANLNVVAAVITAGVQLGGRVAMGTGTAPTTYTLRSGDLISARSIATLDAEGGVAGAKARVTLTDSAAITTKAEVRSLAEYNHRAGANIANLVLHPGSNFSRAGAVGSCDIAAGTIWRGSTRRFDVPGTTCNYNGAGGTAAFTLVGEVSGSMNNDGGGSSGFGA